MMNRYLGAVALALGLAFAGLITPASAAPVGPAVAGVKADTASQAETVHYRRWHRRHWGYYGYRPYYYRPGYYRPYYYSSGPGVYLNFGWGPRWHHRRHWNRW